MVTDPPTTLLKFVPLRCSRQLARVHGVHGVGAAVRVLGGEVGTLGGREAAWRRRSILAPARWRGATPRSPGGYNEGRRLPRLFAHRETTGVSCGTPCTRVVGRGGMRAQSLARWRAKG
eukprot:scaffold83807_cov57-Phaeocystis_antarctica.AAC.4